MDDRQQMSDHDLLIRIDERTEGIDGRVGDHAERLRELEVNQSKILSYMVVIGSGIMFGLKALFALWDKIWK